MKKKYNNKRKNILENAIYYKKSQVRKQKK